MDGHLVVAGPDSVAFVSSAPFGAETTGLRFAPGAAPSVLRVPASELHGQRVRLAELSARYCGGKRMRCRSVTRSC